MRAGPRSGRVRVVSMRQTGSQLVAVVDDDTSVRTAIRSLLRSLTFSVVVFASADELLSSGRLDEIGCLILDVRMPGKTGIELQRELLATGRACPIVFISAHDEDTARREALARGAIAFLRKPFAEEALVGAVRSALGGKGGGSGVTP